MVRNRLWKQVLGLAVLLVAVVLSWMVYDFYQPVILTSLGFGSWVVALGVFQGVLGGIVEPAIGALSDRFASRLGDRLPQITVGITLAGLLFVLTAVLLQVQIPGPLRWIVPVLMTAWVIAMLIFRGPAIALLRQLAPTRELPAANGVLTLVFALAGAIGPLFLDLIQQLGMSLAFLLGALLLAGGGIVIWTSQPRFQGLQHPDDAPQLPETPIPDRWICAVILMTGWGTGSLVNLMLRTVPTVLQAKLGSGTTLSSGQLVAIMLLIGAIVTLPLERLGRRWGLGRSLLVSASGVAGTIVAVHSGVVSSVLLLLVCGGVFLGWLFVTQVPWVLTAVPADHAGLSVGLIEKRKVI